MPALGAEKVVLGEIAFLLEKCRERGGGTVIGNWELGIGEEVHVQDPNRLYCVK
jgi:hypothetical protein